MTSDTGMKAEPLRTILLSYGLALLAAGSLAAVGVGWIAAAAVFWIGGAVAALGMAARAAARQIDPVAAVTEGFVDWETDRAADRLKNHGAGEARDRV